MKNNNSKKIVLVTLLTGALTIFVNYLYPMNAPIWSIFYMISYLWISKVLFE